CFLEINTLDAESFKLKDNDMVRISSRKGNLKVKVKIKKDMPQGILFLPRFLKGVNILDNKVKIEKV
ncbi:MAG: hypothetical protein DRP55_01420, partial [Spirochaetes bacterium]